jgi:hypothetical protein
MNDRTPYRSFVSYIDLSREYYAAQGYKKPYTWLHYSSVPFARLKKPLSECRIGLITTASNVDLGANMKDGMKTRSIYATPSNPAPDRLFTTHLGWDRDTTHTDDMESFLPLKRLSQYVASGRIGSISPRFYGAATGYSQGRTRLKDAPKILEWALEDGVDAMLLSAL